MLAKRLLLLLLLIVPALVQARLEVTVTGGAEGALPIAIVPFGWDGDEVLSEDIAAIIKTDLAGSGRFAPLSNEQLAGRPVHGDAIDFAAWRAAGVETLLVGQVKNGNGRYQVRFQLFDVLRAKQLAGYAIPSRGPLLRRTAHQISDLVYEELTGERGAFNTHITYVTVEDIAEGERRFRLAVADADGFNEQTILTSKQPLMSPAWSPDGKQLAYVSFEARRSVVYVQNVISGKREKVAEYDGINSAPAWSPDGRRLALTLSKDGNPEIYILDLRTRALTRITRHSAIDTEPTWMPDGNALLFTSDRGGRPQIYRVATGSQGTVGRPQRISFEGRYNARPSVSPDGRNLVMVHQSRSGFQIAVQNLETGNLRILTDSRLDESPSFAPNGRMIIFATERRGRGVLEAISVDGSARQRLDLTGFDVREPAWSPFFAE
ncbi:Tol-Pal system beta propeller repeat protein TolB [Thiohalomonas denitrificans]|uniref:Tol-Pal system protein TolB n=1 Tax=Thiohalomonas denitrificans TaxID=415747 RepID=A0A1G5PKN4_9GAMM|nr:Tol-Pal system beta propeller repeat protein TolB [Thiohalomonas denitrificans]SCZ50095.1 TolB protein [Thiohalomonas denitrificans]